VLFREGAVFCDGATVPPRSGLAAPIPGMFRNGWTGAFCVLLAHIQKGLVRSSLAAAASALWRSLPARRSLRFGDRAGRNGTRES